MVLLLYTLYFYSSLLNIFAGRHGVPDKGDGEKYTTMRNSKLEVLRGMERLTKNEKSKALNIASGFKSKNSFFKVVMQPSYVLTNCLVSKQKCFYVTMSVETQTIFCCHFENYSHNSLLFFPLCIFRRFRQNLQGNI